MSKEPAKPSESLVQQLLSERRELKVTVERLRLELAEAQAWMANDEPLLNAGKPLATGRVRELVDILSELEPSEDGDDRGGSPAIGQA